MTNRVTPPDEVGVALDLLLEPSGEYSLEELEAAWEAFGHRHANAGVGRGWRSWGYWRFEIGEDPPEDRLQQPVRLAELGELTDEERAKLAEDAQRSCEFLAKGPPFYHGADRGAQEKLDLWERVQRARSSSDPAAA